MVEIRFPLGEHISNAVAQALGRRGIDVLTAAEAGLLGAPDAAYLEHAREQGRVVVTQDRDFLRLHHDRRPHAGIAYRGQGTRTTVQWITGLLLIHDVLETDDMVGKVEFI